MKKQKLKTNPNGPYKLKITFKNVKWNITIENESEDTFKVLARSNVKVNSEEIETLKNYLQAEGFEEEAQEHNLFW
jgi:hypothetical protein